MTKERRELEIANKNLWKQTNKRKNEQNKKIRNFIMDLFSKYACANVIYFVPVCTSTYRMGKETRLKIALELNIKSARVVVNLALN